MTDPGDLIAAFTPARPVLPGSVQVGGSCWPLHRGSGRSQVPGAPYHGMQRDSL